jgi:fructokinase
MFIEILKIAEANKDGFTVNIESFKHVTSGIVVAYKETQNAFDYEGLIKCVEHALLHDKVIGGWFNEDNGKFYYDSCKIFTNEAEAIEFGRANGQIAIFDLTNLREIRL